ncbi:hypothetical protein Taro_009133 [Colocasia esculenta]|uniref:Protein kinase domain-containing protein n=1 Tax=Colocasia esculenta TaxID=4460 RepID=A0A843U456_COLES|nr:hypothetical protein [Colocasia esculenta]
MEAPLQALLFASVSFFVVSLLLGLFILYCRYSQAHRSSALDLPVSNDEAPARRPLNFPEGSASFDPSLVHISISELAAATGNFSPDCIIGDGSFGFVYKARLPDGTTVAVKKLAPDAYQGFREFRAEVETLGHIRHRNLVRIMGYCVSGSDRLLIYEFMERGSLDQWLHDYPPRDPLPWRTRVRVVRGVAAGLAFLHGECKPRIIHRDIKASNVLLDGGFEARITDFGLARRVDSSRSHVSTVVAGTTGYMPPEYREGMVAATTKADVYSFGALMFEVAMRRRPNWPVVMQGKEEELVTWARWMVEQGKGAEILDGGMGREGVREAEVEGFLEVACRCTCVRAKQRPDMEEVVSLLSQVSVLGAD